MKKLFLSLSASLLAAVLFTGCIGLSLGGGSRSETHAPTLGQQLIDLQKARDAGAISQADYDRKRAELIDKK